MINTVQVLILTFLIILAFLFMATTDVYGQSGLPGDYTINEEEANALVDDVKDEVIPYAREGVSIMHRMITRVVNIFMPESANVPQGFSTALGIGLTIVAAVLAIAKITNHFQKVIMVVIIIAIGAFILLPQVNV